jgi:hypothetical protein
MVINKMEKITNIQEEREKKISAIREIIKRYDTRLVDGEITMEDYEENLKKIRELRKKIKEDRNIDCVGLYFWHILIGSSLDNKKYQHDTMRLDTDEGDIERFIHEVLDK